MMFAVVLAATGNVVINLMMVSTVEVNLY